MMQMDETAIKKEHENGVSIIEPTQKIVDDICLQGYKNIFYIFSLLLAFIIKLFIISIASH